MARKKRNLIHSNAKKVSEENITLGHINKIFLDLYDDCEAFEDKDSLELARRVRKLCGMLELAVSKFNKRMKHEFNNLEYLQKVNRERQAEMTDAQLAALYRNRAKEIAKQVHGEMGVTEDLIDVEIRHMIKAYREKAGDRLNYNTQMKQEIEKKITSFKPEDIDFNDETLF